MGGGARALVRQLKTAVFLRKSPKLAGHQSFNADYAVQRGLFKLSLSSCCGIIGLPCSEKK